MKTNWKWHMRRKWSKWEKVVFSYCPGCETCHTFCLIPAGFPITHVLLEAVCPYFGILDEWLYILICDCELCSQINLWLPDEALIHFPPSLERSFFLSLGAFIVAFVYAIPPNHLYPIFVVDGDDIFYYCY